MGPPLFLTIGVVAVSLCIAFILRQHSHSNAKATSTLKRTSSPIAQIDWKEVLPIFMLHYVYI
jgi:hypothetical protein